MHVLLGTAAWVQSVSAFSPTHANLTEEKDFCLAYRVEQQRFQSEMDKLQHALEAKEAQMQRVVSGTGQVSALKQHYDRVLTDLAGERDVLQADRTRLLQVCHKIA